MSRFKVVHLYIHLQLHYCDGTSGIDAEHSPPSAQTLRLQSGHTLTKHSTGRLRKATSSKREREDKF